MVAADALAWALAAVLAGSGVYCVLVVLAVSSYRRARLPLARDLPPLSVLKPLAGLDDGLEQNLRSLFEQRYPLFEVLLAVRTDADPAVSLVRRLQSEYSGVPSRLMFVGEPPWANAKCWSLHCMTAEANHDLLVMSDSDIRLPADSLRVIGGEFAADPQLGVSSCPYRAVGGPSLPSRLEAIGMNTEFLAGVLVARMLEGVRFALGPTLSARRAAIQSAGGWPELAEFLAEDFVLGNRVAERGFRVILSSAVVEHRIGSQDWKQNARHRLRWFRSTRRSRPAGYAGQLFTYPLPLVLLACTVQPSWLWFGGAVLLARAAAAVATAGFVVNDRATLRQPWLIALQDLLSFGFWIAGFFGKRVRWRGQDYDVLADGRFRRATR